MTAMQIANVKNMFDHFSDYMNHDGDWTIKEIVEMHRLFKASKNVINCKNIFAALERANKIMHGHGVEAVLNQDQRTVGLYVNMGETYASTIIYDCLSDKFYVGTWGDWREWRENNKAYNLKEPN